MHRLRLTPKSEELVAEWTAQASPADRSLIAVFLETVAEGTWRRRWWNAPYLADPDSYEVRPDEGLYVFIQLMTEPEGDLTWLEIITIHRDCESSDGD